MILIWKVWVVATISKEWKMVNKYTSIESNVPNIQWVYPEETPVCFLNHQSMYVGSCLLSPMAACERLYTNFCWISQQLRILDK